MTAWRRALAAVALAFAGVAAATPVLVPVLVPGEVTALRVELPADLRQRAGAGRLSRVIEARVLVVAPPGFDADREWPLLLVSATSDPGHSSSRALLESYRGAAAEAGWVIVAADPWPEPTQDEDSLSLRFALDRAALAALQPAWRGAERAPLAFAGFSGGAKYAGSLAALFAPQGAPVAGVYMAGVNEAALLRAARQLGVLDDTMLGIPVLLQGGLRDPVATPAQHRRVLREMQDAGFRHLRLEFVDGGHVVDAAALAQALAWFGRLRLSPRWPVPAGPPAAGAAASAPAAR